MFKENCKSPLFTGKGKEKTYHSISKLKSKRIVLPLLNDFQSGPTKIKKSFFSIKNNTAKENIFSSAKKKDSNLIQFHSPNSSQFSNYNKKRTSRLGIESAYNLKKKNKYNIEQVDSEENPTKKNVKRRFNSSKKYFLKNKKPISFTEIKEKKNLTSNLPLIDTSILPYQEHQNINNEIATNSRNRFQSMKKLSLNFDFHGMDHATHTRTGENDNGLTKDNNQDASTILKNICGIDSYDIYGIMDGHGANGHLVSNFVKNKVEEYFNNKKNYKIKNLNNKINASKETDIDISSEIYEKIKKDDYELIKNFFKKTDDELYDTKFDVHFSGTTCVLVFKIGKKIICANVGDSRAILLERKIAFDEKTNEIVNKYDIIELSQDHKPNREGERERIEKSGGEVEQQTLIEGEEKTDDLPFRVWKKGCDYPGLAISRTLGDKIAEEIGVISEPEILEFDINKNSKYIIMGSDGVFEYLTNNEIVEISKKYLNNENLLKACCAVVEKSAKLFKQNESRVDDITINIISI